MAIKKSQLYSSIWASCDELRGGMDASQYKDYVLVLLFVKYVSDKYAGKPYAPITVPPGASFKDMVALKGKSDIGDQVNKKILEPLRKANNLSTMPDFNDPSKLGSGKELVDRLTNLIAIFENPALDFSRNRADGDDLMGDAYEYLMRNFATESGKSKGQFYTPAEVSRVIAQILGIRYAQTTNKTTIYDPTCGSGSLLIKVADEASHDKNIKVTLNGQEKDSATTGLARMNMVLHDYAGARIEQGNTLANPLFTENDQLKTFDYVVANPPFSDKRWTSGMHPKEGGKPAAGEEATARKDWGRFEGIGIPPAKNGDYAYLLHILRSLKPDGKGACILPHGVLFRGGAEAAIRKNLVQRRYIKGIIGLPPNLFYGTGIPACIIVLDKEGARVRKGIFMIDASKGFKKDGNKNRLRDQDIHKIVDTFTRQAAIDGYSRMVPVADIADPRNDYNLNLPRYIDSSGPEDLQDIDGHLRGGIPERDIDALGRFWKVIPGVRAELFESAGRPGYTRLKVTTPEIKPTVLAHREFIAFSQAAAQLFDGWKAANIPGLKGIDGKTRAKVLIESLSEGLLKTFEGSKLLDTYAVYQHLMDYWDEAMKDDVYLIVGDGWKEAAKPRLIVEDKNAKTKEKPDLVIGKRKYKTELIPPALLIARYFAADQVALDALEAELASIEAAMDEMAEEHGGEEGLLAEAKNDKDKLTKASVAARLMEVTNDPESADECKVLKEYLELIEKQAAASAKIKVAQQALTAKVAAQYEKLTDDEIKTLVVDDKWLAVLSAAVRGEVTSVSELIAGRIRQLAERYETPLPQINNEVAALAARVDAHLKKMGAAWM